MPVVGVVTPVDQPLGRVFQAGLEHRGGYGLHPQADGLVIDPMRPAVARGGLTRLRVRGLGPGAGATGIATFCAGSDGQASDGQAKEDGERRKSEGHGWVLVRATQRTQARRVRCGTAGYGGVA